MREILFRAKAINRDTGYHRTKYKNGDWVYGLIIKPHYDDFPTIPMEMRNTDGIGGIDVDYKTVGQFTGLTDKNGKKIFEGDIVKIIAPISDFDDNGGKIIVGEMIFDDACFWLKGYGGVAPYAPYWNECELEVIGNIHDNPELLGE